MSLDNTFKSFLKEDNTNPTIPSSGNVLMGLDHEEQERMLKDMNNMLVGITNSPAFNPYYILERIKTRLKLSLGVSFDDCYFLGEIGSFEKPLFAHNETVSNYGGNSQTIPQTNAWMKLFPHGLMLKVQFVKAGPLYVVNAEIVPIADITLPPSLT